MNNASTTFVKSIVMKRISYLLFFIILLVFGSCVKEEVSEIKNEKPVIEIIYPHDNIGYRINDTMIFSFIANDPDGEVKSVWLYGNKILLAIDTVAPWQIPVVFNSDISYHFTVFALDDTGEQSNFDGVYVYPFMGEEPNMYFSTNPDINSNFVEGDSIELVSTAYSSDESKLIQTIYFNDNAIISSDERRVSYVYKNLPIGYHRTYSIVEDIEGNKFKSYDFFINVTENRPSVFEVNISSYGLDVPGLPIPVSVNVADSDTEIVGVSLFVNDQLFSTDDGNSLSDYFIPQTGGNFKFYAEAVDSRGFVSVSDTIHFQVEDGFVYEGSIAALSASNQPDLVFALSGSNNKLLLVNPYIQSYQESLLPYYKPVMISYSSSDQKLYIVYENDLVVSVLDQQNLSFSEFRFDVLNEIEEIKDIEIDPIGRRIFIIAEDDLVILDQDDGSLLNQVRFSGYHSLEIDAEEQYMVVYFWTGYSEMFKIYDISTNEPSLLESKTFSANSMVDLLTLNTVHDFIIINSDVRSDALLAVNALDLNSLYGAIPVKGYISRVSYSYQKDLLFVVSEVGFSNVLNLYNTSNLNSFSNFSLALSNTNLVISNETQDKLVLYRSGGNFGSNALYFIDLNIN